MARQNSLITFTGKLGNVIGYERNGKYFLRSMPEIVRQTTATRRAAKRFGMASRKAALIRNAFYDDLDIRCDSSHINRLNRMLIEAAGGHAAIKGFRFNQYAGTERFFSLAPRLFRNGILHIPPQTLADCKDITALEVKVIATRIDFSTRQITGTETAVMMIDPRQYFAGADVSLDVQGTGTLIITLQVRGMLTDTASSNRQYQSAENIGVGKEYAALSRYTYGDANSSYQLGDIIAVMEPQIHKLSDKGTCPREVMIQQERSEDLICAPGCLYAIRRE